MGGAAGGLARAALAEVEAGWPWPTLLVNLIGAFLLGVVVMYGRRHWRPMVVAGISVGLLGALTTFSTVAGELWGMFDAADWPALASYAVASALGGLLAAGAGVRAGRAVR